MTTASSIPHAPSPNPALAGLAVLVGRWDLTIARARFLPDPSATLSGTAVIEWAEGGAFLVIRQGAQPTPPYSTWMIGRDDAGPTYQALYADDRGVSRVYAMTFTGGAWRLWRDAPRFRQRFATALSPDASRLEGAWEISTDDVTWEHDFDLIYIRSGQS